MSTKSRIRVCGRYWETIAVGVAALALLLTTLADPGLVWDEPPAIERQHAMHAWFGRLFGGGIWRAEAFRPSGEQFPCDCQSCQAALELPDDPFDPRALELGWPFAREAPNEHPPVSAILSYLTWRTTQGFVGPLRAHRLATAIVFALLVSVSFHLVRSRWGVLAALLTVGALLASPRLFIHAHLATTDVIMASFWFLAAVAFWHTSRTGRRPWLFGLLVGLSVMTKLTGGLVLVPVLVWSLLYRPGHARRVWVRTLPVVLGVMVVVQPSWWPLPSDPLRPVEGIRRWSQALIHHPQDVPVYFVGRVYDYRTNYLPWYNAPLLTAITIPIGLLVLTTVGSIGALHEVGSRLSAFGLRASGIRRQKSEARSLKSDSRSPIADPRYPAAAFDSLAGLALLNAVTLLLARTFSWMPGHDGVRQFLAAFPFMALLAGYGTFSLLRQNRGISKWPKLNAGAAAMVILALASAAVQAAIIHPFGLSYYSELVAGTRGAQELGMETTYYWDAVTDRVRTWINEQLPPESTLVIAPGPNVRGFEWYQRWGQLRSDLLFQQWDRSSAHWLATGPRDGYLILLMREGLIGSNALLRPLVRGPAVYELRPKSTRVRLLAIYSADTFKKFWPERPL